MCQLNLEETFLWLLPDQTQVKDEKELGFFEVNGLDHVSVIEEWENIELKEHYLGFKKGKRIMIVDLQIHSEEDN